MCVSANSIEEVLGEARITNKEVAAAVCGSPKFATFAENDADIQMLQEVTTEVNTRLEGFGVQIEAHDVPPSHVISCDLKAGTYSTGIRGVALNTAYLDEASLGQGLYYSGPKSVFPSFFAINQTVTDPAEKKAVTAHEYAHTLQFEIGVPHWIVEPTANVSASKSDTYVEQGIVLQAVTREIQKKGIATDGMGYIMQAVFSETDPEIDFKELFTTLLKDLKINDAEKQYFIEEILLCDNTSEFPNKLKQFLKNSNHPGEWIKFLIESDKEIADDKTGGVYELTINRQVKNIVTYAEIGYMAFGGEKSSQDVSETTDIRIANSDELFSLQYLESLFRDQENAVFSNTGPSLSGDKDQVRQRDEIDHVLATNHVASHMLKNPLSALLMFVSGLGFFRRFRKRD